MNAVSVFSKIPNLLNELKIVLPSINFQEILSDKDSKIKESEIIIGDFDLLAPTIYDLPNTKWIQGTWAGVDKILSSIDKSKPLPFVITRFSGEHFGRIMGEYVLYCIINHERQFEVVWENQKSKNWSQKGTIQNYRVISDLNIGILGIGQIGNWIGQILNKLGASIFGYGRRPSVNLSEAGYLKQYYTKPTLSEFLKNCDYIVNVLPSTSETRGLLNGNVLENCKGRKTVFINIGRGSIISETDLVESINKGWLSAAILDVFDTEPLPQESLLWSLPQVKITPHVAGTSRAKDIAEQFKNNYNLYQNKKPIPTTLDIGRGY